MDITARRQLCVTENLTVIEPLSEDTETFALSWESCCNTLPLDKAERKVLCTCKLHVLIYITSHGESKLLQYNLFNFGLKKVPDYFAFFAFFHHVV